MQERFVDLAEIQKFCIQSKKCHKLSVLWDLNVCFPTSKICVSISNFILGSFVESIT